MNYRQSIIEDSFSIATSGTKTIDIPKGMKISRLTLLPKVTNPNAYVAVGHPDEIVSKIELIDGNNVLFNLTGTQAKALGFYSSRMVPVSAVNYMALQWSFCPIDIYFGRYLWDREYGLDTDRFTNLQLKITHDIDASMTSATTGYITVKADVFDQNPPSFSGYFKAQQFYNLTLVASAVNYIDLPGDLPIRLLLTHCFSDTQGPEYQVDSLKLTEGGDNRIILNSPMEEIEAYCLGDFPKWYEKMYGGLITTARNYWGTPSYEQSVATVEASDGNSTIYLSPTGGQKRIILGEAACNFEGFVFGYAPHGSVPLVYPRQDIPEEYWDVAAAKGARLQVNVAASPDTTPTWDVLLQQLVR